MSFYGYEDALRAAGAEVYAFEAFGSYQGEWFAHVTYNGVTGYVNGCYGSCSGCDAFEAEMPWHEGCEEHYNPIDGCAACLAAKHDYAQKLANFGREYLDNLLTYEQVLAQAGKHSWDGESDNMIAWVKAHV